MVFQDWPIDKCNTRVDFNFSIWNANKHRYLYDIIPLVYCLPPIGKQDNMPNKLPPHQSNGTSRAHAFQFKYQKGQWYH